MATAPGERPSANLRPLLDIVRKLNSETDVGKLLELVLEVMVKSCKASRGTLFLFKGKGVQSKSWLDQTGRGFTVADRRQLVFTVREVRDTRRKVVWADAGKDAALEA